jgi:L-iditol 2-dehydrogenase
MGLLQAALGKTLGASPVILGGITPHRLDFAQRFADIVIDVSKQDLAETLKKQVSDEPEKIIVSVGSEEVVQDALKLVAKGGTVNIFAGMPKDAALTLPLNRIHYDEISVVGTFGFGPHHFRQAVDILGRRDTDLTGMFTHSVTLDEIEVALQAASRYEGIKGVLVP